MSTTGIKPHLSRIQNIMTRGGEPAANLKEAAEVLKGSAVFELGPEISVQALERSGIHRTMALKVAAEAFEIPQSEVLGQIGKLGAALEARFRGVPSNWESIGGADGRVFFVNGNITSPELQADVLVLPQKPRGARGGVVGALSNFAEATGGALGAAYEKALGAYDSLVNRSTSKRLPPGTTFSARLGLDASYEAPTLFLHAVTAPLDEKFRLDNSEVSRDDRLINYGDKLDRIFLQLQQDIASNPDITRVALPIIGTGKGLPMVTFGEAAMVLKDRIAAFQKEYPEVEFLFVSENVAKDASYSTDLKEFMDVYTGKRTDLSPPQASDSRMMLAAAVAAHQIPVSGKATLNDALVDEKLDAWASQFLDALKPLEKDLEALNDRATARAYLKGADREAFSMLHKALELPSLRAEIFGVKKSERLDPHLVSLADIQKALQQPAIRNAIKQVLRDQLPNVYGRAGSFSGEQDMGQIIAGALGAHLLDTLNTRHAEIRSGLDDQLKTAQDQVDEIARRLQLTDAQLAQLRSENANLNKQVSELEKELTSTTRTAERNRDVADSTKVQLADAKNELASLRRALQGEREAVTTRRNYSSGFSYASSGGS